jgi:hypothetical protein
MEIIEAFVAGKRTDQNLCEDVIALTPDFAAVIDGATDPSGASFNGVSGGRFAALTLADTISALPRETSAHEAINTLTQSLHDAVDTSDTIGVPTYSPCASIVIYSDHHREIWSVGDCAYRVDEHERHPHKEIDEVTAAYRRAWTWALLSSGAHPDQIRAQDPGFQAMWPLVEMQERFANTTGTPYSYGVLNGTDVPSEHIEMRKVGAAGILALSSDGYPRLLGTRAASDAYLTKALAADPMSLSASAPNRGWLPGLASYDDRAWIQLRP